MRKKEMLEKPFYLIARYWLGDLDGFITIGDNEEEITELFNERYKSTIEHDFGVTEESYSLLKVSASEILDDKDEQSPYCEVCGHCGEIGCCGIRNFIEEHIKGKTNCKNEDFVICDLISLCEYKDKIFDENKQLKNNWNKLKEYVNKMHEYFLYTDVNEIYKQSMKEDNSFPNLFNLSELNASDRILSSIFKKMQELEQGSDIK